MQTARTETPLELYLKVRDGAYGYVKIAPGLVIGEAENGELLLNSRRPGEQLIQFDQSSDGLVVQALQQEHELTFWESNVQHAVDAVDILFDVRIKLPYNDLLVTQDPLNTMVHGKIKLAKRAEPDVPTLVEEADTANVVSIVPEALPSKVSFTRATAWAGGLTAICIGVLAFVLIEVQRWHSGGAAYEVTALELPGYATLSTVVREPRVINPQHIHPIVLSDVPQVAPPVMLGLPLGLADVPQFRTVEREAHVIKDMLDHGNLLWPEEQNGLTRLTALLKDHSSHPAVRSLFARSAGILATVAEDLFARGYRYDASNLVKQALNVAPTDKRVLSLQQRFSDALREHHGTRLFDNPVEAATSG